MRPFLLFLLSFPVLIFPLQAQFGKSVGATSSVSELVSEEKVIAPGKPFTVALHLTHPENWHSYYLNSGGVELAPAIQWTLPAGFTAGPIQWPVPEVKDGYFGKSFIYSGSPAFLVELTPPATLAAGEAVSLTADATWQICEQSCIDESARFSLTLQTAAENEVDPQQVAFFQRARAAQPSAATGWKFSAVPGSADVVLRVTPDPAWDGEIVDFVPNQAFLQPISADGTIRRDGDSWTLTLKRRTVDFLDAPIPQGDVISGILTGTRPVAIPETPITEPGVQAVDAAIKPAANYFFIFGGMLLGGLILNLMPCVFPVIGIKIMGFVQQAGHDRKKIIAHGLVFAAGVLVSFWVLALALYLGGITNWGNQLQDPRVILATLLIMLLLGMNLFGVFELGTAATGIGGGLQRKQGISGTFFSGVLATVVATPCSGPFLGVAIGAAVTLPMLPFFLAFTCMALGLALPYLVLSLNPALVDRLPRPGPWMESFKQGMSFLLFATAGVFLWVYSAQVFDRDEGQKGLWVMLGISAIATAAWIYGRWDLPTRSRLTRLTAKLAAVILVVSGIAAAWPWAPPVVQAGQEKPSVEWLTWSEEAADRALAAGHPVFIDFTAKWCLTCQLNKSRAYTEEVVKLMYEKGIVALRADKTNPNAAIEAKLQELGRTAIPVNVLLVPGKEPIITPELLSPAYLIALFTEQIPAKAPVAP
ncbi:MAG: thioredoxin family protein [Akkermansiaceae bacterium]